eukprot:833385-Prorocentrum_minimum.AAC.1
MPPSRELFIKPLPCQATPPLGLHAAIKPLLSRSTTEELEFNSPPKYLRTPKKSARVEVCPLSPSPVKPLHH